MLWKRISLIDLPTAFLALELEAALVSNIRQTNKVAYVVV